jgi:LysM repeat protein
MPGTPKGAKVGWAKRKGEYVLQKGDSIKSIAKKLGVSVKKVISKNKLTSPSQVKEGLKLKIK